MSNIDQENISELTHRKLSSRFLSFSIIKALTWIDFVGSSTSGKESSYSTGSPLFYGSL